MKRCALLCFVLIACSQQTAVSVAVPIPAPPPSSEEPDRVVLHPESARYLIEDNLHREQQFGQQVHTVRLRRRIYLETLVFSELGGFGVTFVIDSVIPDPSSRMPGIDVKQLYAGARALSFFGRLDSSTGELFSTPGDTTSIVAQELRSIVERHYPKLPPQGVIPGDTWNDTTQASSRSNGFDITVANRTLHRVVGWTEFDGRPALEIVSTVEYTLTGDGRQAGQELRIDGMGDQVRTTFLDGEGGFLGSTLTDSRRSTVYVTAAGTSVPVTETSSATTRRLP